MTNNKGLKRAAAVHDISGIGKCSLTVALPIISAAGIETSVIPTAILSAPTGGFPGYTYRDLTEDMLGMARHWTTTGAEFDAVYSGFLGSFRQVNIVSEIIDMLRGENTLVIVDPVAADNGKLYSGFDETFPLEMKKLCSKADIIVPNMTEALFMLGDEYREGPYTEAYILEILERLSEVGPSQIVVTGISLDDRTIGAACYDSGTGKTDFRFDEKINSFYPGTGDVFASVLTAAKLNGLSLSDAAAVSVKFTADAVRRTRDAGTDRRLGINFEAGLPGLLSEIEKYKTKQK